MAILKLRKYGDPVLRRRAEEIPVINEEIKNLASDMLATVKSIGGIGLAGNQVIEEGCLSAPGIYEDVTRAQKVRVRALNLEGKKVEIEGEGLLSRALLHEIDHLNGVLFIDHLSTIKRKLLGKKLRKISTGG